MTNDILAPFVRNLARGPSRSRNLTREEAATALSACLDGTGAPEAVGALFMLMRYRGENAAEIAGFVDALRQRNSDWVDVDAAIDWPSYAAGKSRGLPLYLLAARLVANAGFPVLLHGWNSHQSHPASLSACLDVVHAKVASSPIEAKRVLSGGLAYLPLSEVDQSALNLLKLRDVLGLRSPLNTALRAFNPTRAPVTV
ncbi:MAG: glycosyl transferase family 3, partial [Pikeienuella sp.]